MRHFDATSPTSKSVPKRVPKRTSKSVPKRNNLNILSSATVYWHCVFPDSMSDFTSLATVTTGLVFAYLCLGLSISRSLRGII